MNLKSINTINQYNQSIHTHEGNQTDDINLSSKAQVKGRYAQLHLEIWVGKEKFLP